MNENELVEEVEKNQTNLIDAIEKEEFDEIVETKAEEIQLKKKSEEEKKSVNEMLSQSQTTLADKFGEQQIFDLTKEIGLNERFLLTENLFSGDTNLFSKTFLWRVPVVGSAVTRECKACNEHANAITNATA